MKFASKIFAVLFFVLSAAYAQESNNFSNNGIISLSNEDYNFTVILVNDIAQTISIWDSAVNISGLSSSTKVNVSGVISAFITFVSLKNENVDLTYDVKVRKPDGTFSNNKYDGLTIARAKIKKNIILRGRQLFAIGFDETDAFGKYQFHITVKDSGKTIQNIVMEFELVK
jgi:hypothetical protein